MTYDLQGYSLRCRPTAAVRRLWQMPASSCGTLLNKNVETLNDLLGHIQVGPSWEDYAVEQVCSGLPEWDASFYRTAGGAEVDLVLERGDMILAIEAKASTSPRVGRGFYEAAEDIEATHRFVVAPLRRSDSYPIGRDTVVCTPDALVAQTRP